MDSFIDWTLPAEAIVDQVNAAGASGSPYLSYLKGCKLLCLAAIVEPNELDLRAVQPGSIVRVNQDGTLVVTAGGGSVVRLTRHQLTFYTYETADFAEFLRVFRIVLPQQLGSVPFLDNRDSSIWERGVSVWGNRATIGSDEGESTFLTAEGLVEFTEISPHDRRGLTEPNLSYFKTLFSDLGIVAGNSCLDVGCGDGWATWIFAKLGMRVAGFDISPVGFASVRESLPGVHLAELDYYEAGAYFERHNLTFDFIFCRGLGVAQKIVDWTDPEWREATGRLLERLSPDGVAYWSHHTDRHHRLTAEGFTNPTASTVMTFFRSLGFEVLDVSAYGAVLLLQLVRNNFSPALAARYRRRRAQRRQFALQRFRVASLTSDKDVVWDAFREATAHVATLLAVDGVDDRQRLIVAGTDPLAVVYEAAARVLYMPIMAHWSSGDSAFVANRPIYSPGWLPTRLSDRPTAIVVADPTLEEIARATAGNMTPPIPVLSAWSWLPGSTDEQLGGSFLLSGDQDQNLYPIVQTLLPWPPQSSVPIRVEPLPPNPISEPTVTPSAQMEVASNNQPKTPRETSDWLLVGAGRAIESGDGFTFIALGPQIMCLERTIENPFRLEASLSRRSGGDRDCGLEITGNITWRLTINESGVFLTQSDKSEPVAFASLPTNTSVVCEVHLQGDSLRFLVQGRELHSTISRSKKPKRIRIGVIETSGADTEMGCHELRFTPGTHRPNIPAKE